METKDAVIGVLTVAVIALALLTLYNVLTVPTLKAGHTEIEDFLDQRAYPKISESIPTIMVYVLIPMYDNYEVYLTEDGLPLSSLEDFTTNDLVQINGALYSRDAVDGTGSYWMIEVFSITTGD